MNGHCHLGGIAQARQGEKLEADEMAEYSTSAILSQGYGLGEDNNGFNSTLLNGGGSIRDLERWAGALRHAGDAQNSERVDQTILSVLEQKIYRKIMARSRAKGHR